MIIGTEYYASWVGDWQKSLRCDVAYKRRLGLRLVSIMLSTAITTLELEAHGANVGKCGRDGQQHYS